MAKKFLLVPDSFKGTMGSAGICDLMKQAIRTSYPDAGIVSIPVADGGEGSVDSFVSVLSGQKRSANRPYFSGQARMPHVK